MIGVDEFDVDHPHNVYGYVRDADGLLLRGSIRGNLVTGVVYSQVYPSNTVYRPEFPLLDDQGAVLKEWRQYKAPLTLDTSPDKKLTPGEPLAPYTEIFDANR